MPRTDLSKNKELFEFMGKRNTLCLNKDKTDFSSLGKILYELTKEVFRDNVGICPYCGAPVFEYFLTQQPFLLGYYQNKHKWFVKTAKCINANCPKSHYNNSCDLLLREQFRPGSEINRNKLSSQTQTFRLPTATLSLPMNDEYILQDVLIMLKEAGYTKVVFGRRNINYLYKSNLPEFHYIDWSEQLDLKPAELGYFYTDKNVYKPEIMTVTAYKSQECSCLYDSVDIITMLEYIFYNKLNMFYIERSFVNFGDKSSEYIQMLTEDNIKRRFIEPDSDLQQKYHEIETTFIKLGFSEKVNKERKKFEKFIPPNQPDKNKSKADVIKANSHRYIATHYMGRSSLSREGGNNTPGKTAHPEIAYSMLILNGLEVDLTK